MKPIPKWRKSFAQQAYMHNSKPTDGTISPIFQNWVTFVIILVSISLCSLLLGKVSRHDTHFFLVAKEVPPLDLTPEMQLNFSTVLPPAASSCVNHLILPTVF